MCGIAGIFSNSAIETRVLVDMTRRAAHRGPDGEGYWLLREKGGAGRFFDASETSRDTAPIVAGFGHRRLAILDLSEAGRQPMCDPSGRVWLSYNGEVFNFVELRRELSARGHVFRSSTDTEVILASYLEWGKDCFAHFNGMWAIAIADTRRGVLVLSRDRLGIKPLYYSSSRGVFVFASEIKQILAVPWAKPVADIDTVAEYIDSGYQPPGCTFFRDIYEVMPGTTMTLRMDDPSVRECSCFWEFSIRQAEEKRREELVPRIRDIFRDAVAIRLRSDVPVGVCLSGGLDSSSIYGEMHALGSGTGPFPAFTAVYDNPSFDEDEYVKIMLRRTGGVGHFVVPTADAFMESLERFTYCHDEPVGSLSVFAAWCVMGAARREGVPVLLNGQGGDELFSGYWPAYYVYLAKGFRNRPCRAFRDLVGALMPTGNAEIIRRFPAHARQYLQRRNRRNRRLLLPEWKSRGRTLEKNWAAEALAVSDGEFRLRELRSIHLPRLLKWEDRNSMAFGVEGRYPFLDYRLVELALSIPVERNFRNGWNKYLLRLAFEDILPDEIRWRKTKIGFETPQAEWMTSVLRRPLIEWSRRPSPMLSEIVDLSALTFLAGTVFGSKKIDRMDEGQLLFMRLFFLDAWGRTFCVIVPTASQGTDAETLRGCVVYGRRMGEGGIGGEAPGGLEPVRAEFTIHESETPYSASPRIMVPAARRKSIGIRVCVVTSEWPSDEHPFSGIFIRNHVEHLEREGIEAEVFHFRGNKSAWQYIKAWASLRALLRKQSFDIVHAHFGQSALVVLPASKPFVITFRGSDLEGIIGRNGKPTFVGRSLQAVSRWAARKADMVILVSNSLRKYIDPSLNPRILPSGVDTTLFRPLDRRSCRNELGWDESEFVAVFVGSPDDPNKRFSLAKEAVRLAAEMHPCRLEHVWGVAQKHLPVYLNAADVLLMTSRLEGSPNVVKEALACGLPVVSVPVGDVAERLAGVQGSVLCPDDSPESVARGILEVMEYTERNGRPPFTPEAVVSEAENARKLVGWYRQLLEGR
ncbi:MAG: asparagine synthase (glutamine-hydrolyzing) [Bacteroidota bacterium]|nr:asparagine synthase (glutamine-hydrolyzing) [Bacteroidota bacterium]